MRCDETMVFFNDLTGNRKSYASSFIFVLSMQTLEEYKYFIQVFFIKPDPIISNGDADKWAFRISRAIEPFLFYAGGHNADHGLYILAGELKGVAQEVLEYLADLGRRAHV